MEAFSVPFSREVPKPPVSENPVSQKEPNSQYAKATAALKKNDYRVLKRMPKSYIRPNVTHDDDAFSVANCTKKGMRLNTHQVRILRALAKTGKEMGRLELAVAAGPGKNYGKAWLDGLWNLEERKLVNITPGYGDDTAHQQHFQKITTLGKRLIDVCEKIAKP